MSFIKFITNNTVLHWAKFSKPIRLRPNDVVGQSVDTTTEGIMSDSSFSVRITRKYAGRKYTYPAQDIKFNAAHSCFRYHAGTSVHRFKCKYSARSYRSLSHGNVAHGIICLFLRTGMAGNADKRPPRTSSMLLYSCLFTCLLWP